MKANKSTMKTHLESIQRRQSLKGEIAKVIISIILYESHMLWYIHSVDILYS